jgi:hypothetical protein
MRASPAKYKDLVDLYIRLFRSDLLGDQNSILIIYSLTVQEKAEMG